nr:NADH dehydrogenase subunit 2 [Notomastus sp. GK-2021]
MAYTALFMGTLISISGSNWLVIWVGMELNLLAFLPLLAEKKSQYAESAAKYFLAQASGSILFLFSPTMMITSPSLAPALMLLGLLVKSGSAPAYHWFPNVVASSSWSAAALLMTWQKLAPLGIIASSFQSSYIPIFMLFACLNTLLGAWNGLNQTQLRPLLAYSSLIHMGWMLALLPFAGTLIFTYLVIYSLLLAPLMAILNNVNLSTPKAFHLLTALPGQTTLWLSLCLLNLAGMPPFTGFFLKAFITSMLVKTHFPVAIFLLMSSALSLAFYLNLVILAATTATYMPTNSDIQLFPRLTHKGSYETWFPITYTILSLMSGLWLFQIMCQTGS